MCWSSSSSAADRGAWGGKWWSWGWAPTATATSHPCLGASTTTAIQNQPHLFCTAEHELNVSDSTAPSPPSGTHWGWRRAQAQLHRWWSPDNGASTGSHQQLSPGHARSHHPCPAQTKRCRQTLPGPEHEDKCPEHPREWLGPAVPPAADTHQESSTKRAHSPMPAQLAQPQALPKASTWQQCEALTPYSPGSRECSGGAGLWGVSP